MFQFGIMLVDSYGRFPFAGNNGLGLMQAIVDGRRIDTPYTSNGQAVPDMLREPTTFSPILLSVRQLPNWHLASVSIWTV